MMILADLTATFEHDPDTAHHQAYNSKALIAGFKVADRYDSAKMQFCLSGLDTKAWAKPINLGGMEHAHMVASMNHSIGIQTTKGRTALNHQGGFIIPSFILKSS